MKNLMLYILCAGWVAKIAAQMQLYQYFIPSTDTSTTKAYRLIENGILEPNQFGLTPKKVIIPKSHNIILETIQLTLPTTIALNNTGILLIDEYCGVQVTSKLALVSSKEDLISFLQQMEDNPRSFRTESPARLIEELNKI